MNEPAAEANTVPLPPELLGPAVHATAPRIKGVSGRYDVTEEVGRGGMGRVVRARDQLLLREVALKTIALDDPHSESRFREEARITGQLDHPHVLPVYDLGHDESGRPYFTMKLVRGHESLADVIDALRAGDPRATARFSYERRVQVIQSVCHAMRYAHEKGVVHRDVKPQNVVLGACGEVYLVDWGVARVTAADATRTAVQVQGPASGKDPEVTGTPPYMAPEQLLEGQADPLSDVYSLCAVLYELLTLNYYLGHVGEGIPALGLAKRDRVPVKPEKFTDPVHGRVPRPLSRVCEKGLAKAREQRFQSAQELEEALQRWIEGAAPIVCAGTCMQRLLSRWSHLIDQRPVVMPLVSIAVGGLLLGSLVSTVIRVVDQLRY